MIWLLAALISISVAVLGSVGIIVLSGSDAEPARKPPPVPFLTAVVPQPPAESTEDSSRPTIRPTITIEPVPSPQAGPALSAPTGPPVAQDGRAVSSAPERRSEPPQQNPLPLPPPRRQQRDIT